MHACPQIHRKYPSVCIVGYMSDDAQEVGIFADVDNTLTVGYVQEYYAKRLGCSGDYRRLEADLQRGAISEAQFGDALVQLFRRSGFTSELAIKWAPEIELHPSVAELLHLPVDIYLVSSGPNYYLSYLASQFPSAHINYFCSQYEFDAFGLVESCHSVNRVSKAQYVDAFRIHHRSSVGIGDSLELDGPFMEKCDFAFLILHPEMTGSPASQFMLPGNFVKVESFGPVIDFVSTLF